jgi:hypothetical protein
MILTIDIPFSWGDIVYLKTDVDQKPYMVIGAKTCADGGLLIELQTGTASSFHYIIEISADKNVLLTT